MPVHIGLLNMRENISKEDWGKLESRIQLALQSAFINTYHQLVGHTRGTLECSTGLFPDDIEKVQAHVLQPHGFYFGMAKFKRP